MPLYNRYKFDRSDDMERLMIEEVAYPDLMFNYGMDSSSVRRLRESNQKKIDVLKGMIAELEEANGWCELLAKPHVVEYTVGGETRVYAYSKRKDVRKCLDRLTREARQNAYEGSSAGVTDIRVYTWEVDDGEIVQGEFDAY